MPTISGANGRRERSEKGDLTMGENGVILGAMPNADRIRKGRTLTWAFWIFFLVSIGSMGFSVNVLVTTGLFTIAVLALLIREKL